MPTPAEIAPFIETGAAELAASLERLRPLERAGELTLEMIRARTSRGIDRRGAAFRPYAPSTRRRKARRGQQTAPPNLRDTGQMIADLTVTVSGGWIRTRRAAIRPATARSDRILRFHIAGTRKMPARDPLGLTAREAAVLGLQLEANLRQVVPRARLFRTKLEITI